MKQAKRDLQQAQRALEAGDYEWSCFVSQQSAEKAVKALYQKIGLPSWGYAVSTSLTNLPAAFKPPQELIEQAQELDKHYLATRYPELRSRGIPPEFYTRQEAERVINYARDIINHCENHTGINPFS